MKIVKLPFLIRVLAIVIIMLKIIQYRKDLKDGF